MASGELQQTVHCTSEFISCTFRYPVRWFSKKKKIEAFHVVSVLVNLLREVRVNADSKTKRLKPSPKKELTETHR